MEELFKSSNNRTNKFKKIKNFFNQLKKIFLTLIINLSLLNKDMELFK